MEARARHLEQRRQVGSTVTQQPMYVATGSFRTGTRSAVIEKVARRSISAFLSIAVKHPREAVGNMEKQSSVDRVGEWQAG